MRSPTGRAARARLDRLPSGSAAVAQCRAVFEELPGWTENTKGLRDFDQLPAAARRYIDRLPNWPACRSTSSPPDRTAKRPSCCDHPFK